jgi:DNA ligase D-like protein (predicted 3'-phosphoesterase)
VAAVALRLTVRVDEPPDAIVAQARSLGVRGWVRSGDEGALSIHAEGEPGAMDELCAFLEASSAGGADRLAKQAAKVEGHEQFAVRGVPAGDFVVQEHAATAHHFDLRLEVEGAMRSWALPKGPSMDPGVRRLAVEVAEHDRAHNVFEGRTNGGGVLVWDRGTYEQGGRVAWPEALGRGHAVFVLHGEKLRGGFALQRTRGTGLRAQWLLLKRRDDEARPGSDVVAELPRSVDSGRTLAELLDA